MHVNTRRRARGLVVGVLATLLGAVSCGGGDGVTSTLTVASLRFIGLPGDIAVNQTFNVQVELLNGSGARIASADHQVTLAADGATLSGPTQANAVAGVASFTGLSFATAGTGVTLTASAAGRTSTSASFAADPCAAIPLSIPGSSTGTVTSASCPVGGLRAVVFGFNAPTSGGLGVSVNATFPARIEVTTVPPGTNAGVTNPQGSSVSGEWLLPTGSYLFRVAAVSGTGTFSVATTNPAANSGCVLRILVRGGTFNQSLASGDCTYEDVPNWFADVFAIFANQPCTITQRSTDFDSFLEIWDVNGNPFVGDDDGAGGLDSRIQLEQCGQNGNPVLIVANSLDPGESGAYTLQVQFGDGAGDVTTEPLTIDADVLRSVTMPRLTGTPRLKTKRQD